MHLILSRPLLHQMDCLSLALSLALSLSLSPSLPLSCARTLSLFLYIVVNVHPSLSFFRACDSNRGDHVFHSRQLSSLTLTEAPLSLAHEEASPSARNAGARLRVYCMCVCVRARVRAFALACVYVCVYAFECLHAHA
jgi:hypothetical protein